MADLYSNVLNKETLTIAARTDGTVAGTAVDREEDSSGFESAVIVVHTGTITDGTHTIEIQDSDASGSGFAAVADSYLQGSEPAIVAADDNKVFEIGYLGPKRYVKAVVVTTGATTGGVFGATVILGNPQRGPVVRN